jgi:hypothetical protein
MGQVGPRPNCGDAVHHDMNVAINAIYSLDLGGHPIGGQAFVPLRQVHINLRHQASVLLGLEFAEIGHLGHIPQ